MLAVHRADRADDLVEALGELLAEPPGDPFAPEVVAVHTRGMERWLAQRLSGRLGTSGAGRGDGLCANVQFPFPHRLVSDAVAAASGIEPEQDPWRPERSAWPLLEVVEESLDEPWLTALSHYLRGPVPSGSERGAGPVSRDDARQAGPASAEELHRARRLTTIAHLAELFDRYALHRPAMVRAWASGADVDELGRELPGECRWQAELWRRLRRRIGLPGPAERHEQARRALISDPGLLALPPRISLFGLTRLAAGHLAVLEAVADGRDVHLFLLHPSGALWDRLAGSARQARRSWPLPRERDPTAAPAGHPLLASWGRDAREMQLVLAAMRAPPAQDTDHARERPEPVTLLARLQADVRADRAPPGAPAGGAADLRPPLEEGDRSLQVHACHGRQRQVEVLRDAILHALLEDPTLEPRDVIVMCPDIESFAPLIQASFGTGDLDGPVRGEGAVGDGAEGAGGDGPAEGGRIDLRVRLADRALTQTNALLGVVGALLELTGQRLTASQVLDLADRAPVRRRFGLDDDDLARIQSWIVQAGIRWGLDAAHRAPYSLDRLPEGTWQAGLDRLLLGVAMSEERRRLFAEVLPLDDVDSASIDLAGRLAELLARLGAALDSFSSPRPPAGWARAIAAAADSLADTAPRERWQRAELHRVLEDLVGEAGARADGRQAPALAAAEIRNHLAERLAGRATRANFRTGHLTVCTLMPMRSVPHRVVCLLGLDDGSFPRRALRDGDDLLLTEPLVGERDPRSEDRQLLLDALMAARERLLITYTGNDERTNLRRPPAVPVGELLDVAEATVSVPGEGGLRRRIVVRHPLQPFDPDNFRPGALTPCRSWSFDRITLRGAQALTGPRQPSAPFLAAPLPPRLEPVIELKDLVAFVVAPVRAFLRQRLGISLRTGSDEVRDALAVELDGLERWGVGQRLLEARLAGVDGRSAIRAEIARGKLPPGLLGIPAIHEAYPIAEAILNQALRLTGGAAPGDPIDVRVTLGGGRRLSGTIAGVHGELLLATTYSRVAPKQRLAAWVRLVALTAACPERPYAAATVGRADRGDGVRLAEIPPLGLDPAAREAVATKQLAALVDLRDRGLREPLPLFCRTSAAWAAAADAGRDPVAEAEAEWLTTRPSHPREDSEPEHRLALGGTVRLERLLESRPAPGEAGAGWAAGEDTRLGRLARRLWDPLLACEELSRR